MIDYPNYCFVLNGKLQGGNYPPVSLHQVPSKGDRVYFDDTSFVVTNVEFMFKNQVYYIHIRKARWYER